MPRGKSAAGLLADLSEVKAATLSTKKCAFGRLMEDSFTPEEHQLIEEMLADKKVSSQSLIQVLQKNNVRIGGNTFYAHRRGICSCPKESE